MKVLFAAGYTFLGLWISHSTTAQTISFDLQGSAKPGISAANEPNPDVIDGGSGGLGPSGISLNLETNVLSVDVVWGSANGFVNLSSDIDFMNIHGPTESAASSNFFENGETFSGLNGFDASPSSGGYTGETSFEGTVKRLLEGRYYIHLHTIVNNGGEARGYLIPELVLGDTNNDGLINLLDVSPFVEAISDAQFIDEADINRDGVVNLLDVDPFVRLLAG